MLLFLLGVSSVASFATNGRLTLTLTTSLAKHHNTAPLLFAGFDDGDEEDMKNTPHETKWTTLGEIAQISTPWLTMFGENLLDENGQQLEYWRVEKDDSAVILTLHRGTLVFPRPTYRPGVARCTLDFPGGRVPSSCSTNAGRLEVAWNIVQRELAISDNLSADVLSIERINSVGWPVNSSFSNQKLFGFYATLNDGLDLDESKILRYGTSAKDIDILLEKDLECLQCRAILLEWLRMH